MDVGTISSRYVKALFSLAKEKQQETRVYDDMKMLAVSFEQEPGLKVVLDNPIFPEEEKVKLLTTAAGLEVCDLFTRFIRLVLQRKATREHLKKRLQEETGDTIEFTGVIRPELIGGFVLRIGNIRIDASYSRQLREIRNKLIERN